MAPITINFKEFLQIKWQNDFPTLIVDLIEYLTGFSIHNCVLIRKEAEELVQTEKGF